MVRFEEMGVDFDMLAHRRDRPGGGIADKVAQLTEVREMLADLPADLYGSELADEMNALQSDIDERKKLARQQVAQSLKGSSYSRNFTPEDDTNVALFGGNAFAWVVANQVLSGAKPEESAIHAAWSMDVLADRPEPVLLEGAIDSRAKKQRLLAPNVELGHLGVVAALSPAGADTIYFEGNYRRSGYLRHLSGWEKTLSRPLEDGVSVARYPHGMLVPDNQEQDVNTEPKLLVGSQQIEEQLEKTHQFEEFPELGVALSMSGALSLSESRRAALVEMATYSAGQKLTDLANYVLAKSAQPEKCAPFEYGQYQLLVQEVMTGTGEASTAIRAALKEEIIGTMASAGYDLYSSSKLAVELAGDGVLRRGDEKVRARLKIAIEHLEHAVNPFGDPKYVEHPELTHSVLTSLRVDAVKALRRGEIDECEFKRIQRFVATEGIRNDAELVNT